MDGKISWPPLWATADSRSSRIFSKKNIDDLFARSGCPMCNGIRRSSQKSIFYSQRGRYVHLVRLKTFRDDSWWSREIGFMKAVVFSL